MLAWIRVGAFLVGCTIGCAPVLAKDPVNQCTQPGQPLASAAAEGPSVMITQAASSGGRPDGLVYPTDPKFQALLPKAVATADLGQVNLKTGGYTFRNQDISIGQGEFPARLYIDRTYDSTMADSAPDSIYGPRFGPGAPEIRYFGIGGTHNLDISYRSDLVAFGDQPVYKVINVSLGRNILVFQKCANGEFVSSKRDGNRLFAISSAPNAPPSPGGGYRLELADGARIFLFAEGARVCTAYDDTYSQTECGWASRWEAPNGDWANFNYTKYYDKPDRAINQHLQTDHRIDSYDNSKQLCIATASSSNDCKYIEATYYQYYDSLSGGLEIRMNDAINSYRLSSIQNSRNLKLEFTYLDSTTNVGTICPMMSPGGIGSSLVCYAPANVLQERGQVTQIKAFTGTTLAKSVSYEYTGNLLYKFKAADGGETKYVLPNSDAIHLPQKLQIFLPTDHQNPAVTVDMVLSNGSYFQHLPVGIWQSGMPAHAYRRFPRAVKQTFADGRIVEYQATLKNKWRIRGIKRYNYVGLSTTWTPVEYISKMDVVEPGNAITSYRFDDEDSPLQITDPLTRNTVNTYDDVGNLLTSKLPEGNSVTLTYDARSNVVKRVTQPKASSGLTALTESTSYVGAATVRANGCSNQVTCNRPVSTTDARGAVSNFAWDATTGMMTSAMAPADSAGNRPSTTYGYTAYTAPSGGTIRVLTSETTTISPGQQAVTTYGYDAANRYFPKEIVETSGGTSLRTCIKLGPDGTPISETKPNANLTSCP